MKAKRRTKRVVSTAIATVAAAGLAAVAPVASPVKAASAATSREGIVCTANSNTTTHEANFLLTARSGYATMADGNSIFMWGYAHGNGGFQLPGPVMCVEVGDKVTVTLKNTLPTETSLQFPGMEDVRANGQFVSPQHGSTAMELRSLVDDVPSGGSITYSFIADHAGTFVYQSATDPAFQVQMGLYGALIVRPSAPKDGGEEVALATVVASGLTGNDASTVTRASADGPRLAYGGHHCDELDVVDAAPATAPFCQLRANVGQLDPATIDAKAIYSKNHEYLLLLSEIDPDLHAAVENDKVGIVSSAAYAALGKSYQAHYFLINGRTFPDTIAPNGAAWLPNQPYGALAHVEPFQVADQPIAAAHPTNNGRIGNPIPALIRYASAGPLTYPFHPHSNHENVIAIDGHRQLDGDAELGEEHFAITVDPGATADATFTWTNVEDYADANGKHVPVPVPGQKNLTEGDYWSGSPYLGLQQQLNPGLNTANQCGEYYHVAHSHDLTQATNYGAAFGGMLTLIRVDPAEFVDASKSTGCANG